MKKLALIVIVILLISLFLSADIYTKSVERVKAFELMGQKQPEAIQMKDHWYSKNKYAEIGKDFTFIVDLDKEKMFFALHDRKIYFEIPTDLDSKKLFDVLATLSPKAAEAFKSIRITDAKVNLKTERKKIANWDCTASEFEMVIIIPAINAMPTFKMKMWMTDAFPGSYENISKNSQVIMQKLMGMLNIDENSQNELAKLEDVHGFQIAAEITVELLGKKIEIEAQNLEVEEKPAPPGTYSVPAGYTKQDITFIKDRIKQIPKGASHL